MFKNEGIYDVTITDAFIVEAKFQPKDGERNNQGVPVEAYYDVCIQVSNAEGDSDIWRGEMSNRNGVGNYAQLYRTDLTIKTLQEIGFGVQSMTELENQFVPAQDRSISIPNLIGLKCTATVERREYEDRNTGAKKSFLYIKYLNAPGSGHAKRLSFDDFMNRRRGAAQPAAPAPAYPQQQYQAPAAPITQPSAPSVPVGAGPCPSVSVRETPAQPAAAPAPQQQFQSYPPPPPMAQAPAAPAYAQSVPAAPAAPAVPPAAPAAPAASPACPY